MECGTEAGSGAEVLFSARTSRSASRVPRDASESPIHDEHFAEADRPSRSTASDRGGRCPARARSRPPGRCLRTGPRAAGVRCDRLPSTRPRGCDPRSVSSPGTAARRAVRPVRTPGECRGAWSCARDFRFDDKAAPPSCPWCITFTATSRSKVGSWAAYTTPIPPRAISRDTTKPGTSGNGGEPLG